MKFIVANNGKQAEAVIEFEEIEKEGLQVTDFLDFNNENVQRLLAVLSDSIREQLKIASEYIFKVSCKVEFANSIVRFIFVIGNESELRIKDMNKKYLLIERFSTLRDLVGVGVLDKKEAPLYRTKEGNYAFLIDTKSLTAREKSRLEEYGTFYTSDKVSIDRLITSDSINKLKIMYQITKNG